MSTLPAEAAPAPEACPESLPWTSKTCLSAIDGAVVGNTLGFVVGAFPGMCIGAASGGIAGVLGGGLLAPVLKPAVGVAASAIPGKFVLSANGAANTMIGKLCVGPRTELGKDGQADNAGEQSTDFRLGFPTSAEAHGAGGSGVQEVPEEQAGHAEEPPARPKPPEQQSQLLFFGPARDLNAAKHALDAAMVRASAAGAQGAVAGAEVGGAVVGTALAIPGAVLGSFVGGIVGACAEVHSRYLKREAGETVNPAASGQHSAAPANEDAGPGAPEERRPTN